MLVINVTTEEDFDEEGSKFIPVKTIKVELEHSLVSLSKWEEVWEKSFLNTKDKTPEEMLSYVKLMIVTPDLPPEVFQRIIQHHLGEIREYITAKMTATWFSESRTAQMGREVITAELIYYWMISMSIPMECQHWHLNKLITLIRVINAKNAPKTKMTAAQRAKLNRERLAKHNTRG